VEYDFEWDPVKATENLRKHGVSFERAAQVFLDPFATSIYDEAHGAEEDRWITLGKIETLSCSSLSIPFGRLIQTIATSG
jgi:uncharacterized DUF497 family protein